MIKNSSLADAEVAENDVENILHVNTASEPPERAGGETELLGEDVLAAAFSDRARERPGRFLQEEPLTLARDKAGSREPR